jgi:hypothetical protein
MTNLVGIAGKAGFAALLVAIVPPVHAQSQTPPSAPMTVVNTDADPVPVRAPSPLPVSGNVTIAGTANVNVTNTPGVAQSGAWNVGVLGVPAVSQSGTWNVGITGTPSFSLVPPSTPIPVTLGVPDRTIVQGTVDTFSAHTARYTGTLYHNASNKTLVIEQVSMSTHSSNDTIGGGALILTSTANGIPVPHGVLQVADLPGNERTGAGSAAVRIYVDPGSDVYYDIYVGDLNFNDASHVSRFQVSFSGYLTSSP